MSSNSAPGWTENSAYEDTPPPDNTPLPAPVPEASTPAAPAKEEELEQDQVAYAVNPNTPYASESAPAPTPTHAETVPLPTAMSSGEQVSFAVSSDTPYAASTTVEDAPKRKKEPRKISRSEVQVAEYHIRSTANPADQDRGSKMIYIGLAVVVIPLLLFATYLIVKDGNFFASDKSFAETPKDPLADLAPLPPPTPLKTVLVKVVTTPPGAAVAINGVLQDGETPGDFKVVTGQINTLSFYKDGFTPRHKNARVPSSGSPGEVSVNLLELKIPEGQEMAPKVKLTVQSEPVGARILLDGQEVGQTPMTSEVFSGMEHHITLRKEGFYDHVFLYYVFPELDSKTSMAKLVSKERKAGSRFTEFQVETRKVEVKIEDDFKGIGPWFQPLERNRAVRVELSMSEHYPFRRVLQTTVGSMTLAPELRPIRHDPGLLTLVVKGKGLKIYVKSDEYAANELKNLELPAGEYTVTLVRPSDNKRGEVKVTVDPDNPSTYDIEFSGDKPTVRQVE